MSESITNVNDSLDDFIVLEDNLLGIQLNEPKIVFDFNQNLINEEE